MNQGFAALGLNATETRLFTLKTRRPCAVNIAVQDLSGQSCTLVCHGFERKDDFKRCARPIRVCGEAKLASHGIH